MIAASTVPRRSASYMSCDGIEIGVPPMRSVRRLCIHPAAANLRPRTSSTDFGALEKWRLPGRKVESQSGTVSTYSESRRPAVYTRHSAGLPTSPLSAMNGRPPTSVSGNLPATI
jgi:hypothetical protein